MPSIGQTWVLASIGAVVEMGILSTLKRLLKVIERDLMIDKSNLHAEYVCIYTYMYLFLWIICSFVLYVSVFMTNMYVIMYGDNTELIELNIVQGLTIHLPFRILQKHVFTYITSHALRLEVYSASRLSTSHRYQ
jgi:hypothetical protein